MRLVVLKFPLLCYTRSSCLSCRTLFNEPQTSTKFIYRLSSDRRWLCHARWKICGVFNAIYERWTGCSKEGNGTTNVQTLSWQKTFWYQLGSLRSRFKVSNLTNVNPTFARGSWNARILPGEGGKPHENTVCITIPV